MDLGFERAGHQIVSMCEIDPDARSVLNRHWPNVPVHEDVVTFNCDRWRGAVDIVSGGSPCQDLSVVGAGNGLAGERSSLFWYQCKIAAEVAAPWIVWENVLGVLSSNKGADFASVLWGVTGTFPEVPSTGWKSMGIMVGSQRFAVWRVFDAVWFGTPQRRRRVFLVSGPRESYRDGVQILLEPESVSRHSAPFRKERKGVARFAQGGFDPYGYIGLDIYQDSDLEVVCAFDSNYSGRFDIRNDPHSSPTVKVGSGLSIASPPAVAYRYGQDDVHLRKLTPLECERLMTWPDEWTKFRADGTVIKDRYRYEMCGNGVVSSITQWIGERFNKFIFNSA